MKQLLRQTLTTLIVLLSSTAVWADDFTVERAINLSQLDSWADISKFQWQEIDHGIQDNREEMDALINLFKDPAPKDTVGFYNQIYKARDNQYIVLRLDKAQGTHPFHIRVTAVTDKNDPTKNASKVFSAENYVFIMPPIGEHQMDVKIWPQGEGEETAKTFTFHSHSYGSESVRSMMLDKSRIVPGNYDLQLIRYNEKTEKSDTSYINSLQPDKLYTFYDYYKGHIVEAYLQVDGFKRIKLKPDDWAIDAVTHVNDNSVLVLSGPQMPFRHHKRLDAPNPTYLDSRLFSHHDTLWVNLYLDNIPSKEAEGLTMHAVLADLDNNPIGDKLLTWGKDPVSGRLYVLTDGEPCTIECYRDGYLPKLCFYPGSYHHKTGIISKESEEADIYLESIPAPIKSPTVTSSILSTMATTTDRRGNYYVTDIQQTDVMPALLTDTIYYDEFASHKDTLKILADGRMMFNYGKMEVAIVSPHTAQATSDITLKKVEGVEENAILKETLSGDTRGIYSSLYDYSYWTTAFDLRDYLDINTAGRPSVAFDGTVVRQLPILANFYIDTYQLQQDLTDATLETTAPEEPGNKAKDWITTIEPSAGANLNVKIPLAKPWYVRGGIEIDFVRAKKFSVFVAIGFGWTKDFLEEDDAAGGANAGNGDNPIPAPAPAKDPQSFVLTTGSVDDYGINMTDATPLTELVDFKPANYKQNDENGAFSFKANIFAELYTKISFPLTLKKKPWVQGIHGTFLDEISLRAEANVGITLDVDLFNVMGNLLVGQVGWLDDTQRWLNNNKYTRALRDFFGLKATLNAGTRINVSAGMFAFNNSSGSTAFTKNHIWAFRFNGQAYFHLLLRAKLDAILAGVEGGAGFDTGIDFKYSGGQRLDNKQDFSGSAWSWFLSLSMYYKVKFLGWGKSDALDWGNWKATQELIRPKNYRNPYHKDFVAYLSEKPDPNETSSSRRVSYRPAVTLPGDYVTDYVDLDQPVKFISGGDSIIYQGAYESPNDYTVECASIGNPIVLSDWRKGGCTNYDAASVPGTDMVVMEQATGLIAKEDLEDTLHLDETVKRASRVYSVYYTKKNTGTKWYSPKPIYSSTETTSFKPRVALADNGTAVAIWQEGVMDKGSWVAAEDTVQLYDIVLNGHLMMSRFDGNDTWSEPIKLMAVDEITTLRDYRVTYDGSTAFIIARKQLFRSASQNVCLTVDAADNITTHKVEQTEEMMRLQRVGRHNILAWTAKADTTTVSKSFRVKSYGMDGNASKGINTSLILNQASVEDFRIVPDLQAKSLRNVALLWREKSTVNDSIATRLKAARIVPAKDGSFGIGTPITAVALEDGNTMYNFDGYMYNEKIQVCYVAVDSMGYSQLNKKAAYFGNAFGYTVAFDSQNNQGFQCNKDEITLLITVNNYGTSTINECVLTVGSRQYPLDMTIPAGAYAQERVTIPYLIGTGLNTTMRVKYDDVLGTQEQSYARYMSRRAARLDRRNTNRSAEDKKEDGTYEQHTALFYPYRPQLETFVVAQRVDEEGNNLITICVRNHTRRKLDGDFAVIVGLKETPHSAIAYQGTGENAFETKMLFSNANDMREGKNDSYMYDYGSYRAGYVTLKVSNVTEKKKMLVGATLIYKEPNTGLYMRLMPLSAGANNSGAVTLYPSAETVAIEKVYNNDDAEARMHVSQQAGNLVVTGVKPHQQVRLYHASGAIVARCKADENGKATFHTPYGSGVGLVSSGKETVKFVY